MLSHCWNKWNVPGRLIAKALIAVPSCVGAIRVDPRICSCKECSSAMLGLKISSVGLVKQNS